jgi:UDP-N-acetylmuramoyl-L-alanyl-D-glutamate--2,6-diaminopimelate ligase
MELFDLIRELDTIETNADLHMNITDIQNDSRKVTPGCLFVAISGSANDGHIYIPKAVENGAAVVVSQRRLNIDCPSVIVPDTREALFRLGSAFFGHPSRKMHMIGVTGTNGKTTITHLIYGLLKAHSGCVPSLVGTNHILIGNEERPSERTTPDAVSLHRLFADMVKAGSTHCVMEVSSHALEQGRVAGIHYDLGVFSNLTQDHLDYHKSFEAYYQAKAKLFEQSALSITNIDDEYGQRLEKEFQMKQTYSLTPKGRLYASSYELHPGSVSLSVRYRGESATLEWGTPGKFTVYNVLAATLSALQLGLPLREIAKSLPQIPPVCGRMEIVPVPADFTVIIDYAHTPDALENVLHTAREVTKGRVITVFGCGGDRDNTKRPLMGGIAQKLSDVCVVTSDNPRTEEPLKIIEDILAGMDKKTAIVEANRTLAIHEALRLAAPGDIVMICGKGHEMYQEVMGVTFPMDEREIVASYWRNNNE